MPFPLSLLFLLTCLGLLGTRPEAGPLRLLTADSAGGRTLRGLLPTLAAAPLLVGGSVFWIMESGWLPRQSGPIFAMVLVISMLGLVVWYLAGTLHRQDLERQRAVAVQRLQAVALDRAADGIFITDSRGVIQWANNALLRCTGYRLEELRGQTPRVFKSGRQDAAFYAQLWATLLANQTWRGELINRDRQGRLFLCEETITPIAFEVNGITHFVAILRDITERKQTEAELQRRLRILESSVNELYVFDAETLRFEYVNAAAVRNLGWSAAQLRQMTPLDLQPEFTHETFRQLLAPLVEGRQSLLRFETVHRRANDTLYPVEVYLQLLREENERPVFLAVILDITERRQAERRLRENEAALRRAQAVAQVGSWTLDFREKRLIWSDETHRIFGTAPGQVTSEADFWGRVHEEDRERVALAWRAALQGAPYRVEHRIRVGNQIKWVEERAELEFDATGQPVLALGTVHDITERRRLEEELRQAQKWKPWGNWPAAWPTISTTSCPSLSCGASYSNPAQWPRKSGKRWRKSGRRPSARRT